MTEAAATKKNPDWLVNGDTGVVYAYSPALAESKSPVFRPLVGPLPPFDGKIGQRVVRAVADVNTEPTDGNADIPPELLTKEQRIERLAAIIHLVNDCDKNEEGIPGTLAIERLSGLTFVKRHEVKKAMKMRIAVLNAKSPHVIKTTDLDSEEVTDGTD